MHTRRRWQAGGMWDAYPTENFRHDCEQINSHNKTLKYSELTPAPLGVLWYLPWGTACEYSLRGWPLQN